MIGFDGGININALNFPQMEQNRMNALCDGKMGNLLLGLVQTKIYKMKNVSIASKNHNTLHMD